MSYMMGNKMMGVWPKFADFSILIVGCVCMCASNRWNHKSVCVTLLVMVEASALQCCETEGETSLWPSVIMTNAIECTLKDQLLRCICTYCSPLLGLSLQTLQTPYKRFKDLDSWFCHWFLYITYIAWQQNASLSLGRVWTALSHPVLKNSVFCAMFSLLDWIPFAFVLTI